jgi:hypothetical protein
MPDEEFFHESTREQSVTEHDRIVEIDGKKVVVPAGAPVARGTVSWGRRPQSQDESDEHPRG